MGGLGIVLVIAFIVWLIYWVWAYAIPYYTKHETVFLTPTSFSVVPHAASVNGSNTQGGCDIVLHLLSPIGAGIKNYIGWGATLTVPGFTTGSPKVIYGTVTGPSDDGGSSPVDPNMIVITTADPSVDCSTGTNTFPLAAGSNLFLYHYLQKLNVQTAYSTST